MSDLYRLPADIEVCDEAVVDPSHEPAWTATTGGTAAVCGRCAAVVAVRAATTRAGWQSCPQAAVGPDGERNYTGPCPSCGQSVTVQAYDVGSGPELACPHCEWCWGANGQPLQPMRLAVDPTHVLSRGEGPIPAGSCLGCGAVLEAAPDIAPGVPTAAGLNACPARWEPGADPPHPDPSGG